MGIISFLDSTEESKKSSTNRVVVIVIPLLAAVTVILVLLLLYAFRKRKLKRKGIMPVKLSCLNQRECSSPYLFYTCAGVLRLDGEATNKIGKNELDLPLFTILQIARATDGFSSDNKLGEGGFGPVYKVTTHTSCSLLIILLLTLSTCNKLFLTFYVYFQGMLDKGQEIAVKRLSKTSRQGIEEFMNEVSCIAKLQHRNLVKLLGCCVEQGERMLIYEYMPNRGLDSIIFGKALTKPSMLMTYRLCSFK